MEVKFLLKSKVIIIIHYCLLLFILFYPNELLSSNNRIEDLNPLNIDYTIISSELENNSFLKEFFFNESNWKNISDITNDELIKKNTNEVKFLVLKLELDIDEEVNNPALLIENSLNNFKLFGLTKKTIHYISGKTEELSVSDNNDLFLSTKRDFDLNLISLLKTKIKNTGKGDSTKTTLFLTIELKKESKLGKIDKIQFGNLDDLTKLSVLDSGSFFNDFMIVFFIIFSSIFLYIFFKTSDKERAKYSFLYFSLFLLSIGFDFLFNNLNFSYLLNNFMNGFSELLRLMNQFLLPIWLILLLLSLYKNEKNSRGNKILLIAIWHLVVIILYYLIDKYIMNLYSINIYKIYNIFEITIISYFFYLYFFKYSDFFKRDLFVNLMIGVFFLLVALELVFKYNFSSEIDIKSNFNFLSYGFFVFTIAFIKILFDYYKNTRYINPNNETNSLNENSKTEMELRRLRSQIIDFRNHLNPVFIKNTFEKMSTLISKDNYEALDFTKELYKVYQYLLNNEGKELSTVKDEIQFIESYYYLYSKCFDGELFLKTDIDDSHLLKRIPILTSQLLFEHAVKYNNISEGNNLTVAVFIEESNIKDYYNLIVRYNLEQRNRFILSSGIALTNLRERFNFFTDEKVQIIDDENTLTIKLPLIK